MSVAARLYPTHTWDMMEFNVLRLLTSLLRVVPPSGMPPFWIRLALICLSNLLNRPPRLLGGAAFLGVLLFKDDADFDELVPQQAPGRRVPVDATAQGARGRSPGDGDIFLGSVRGDVIDQSRDLGRRQLRAVLVLHKSSLMRDALRI